MSCMATASTDATKTKAPFAVYRARKSEMEAELREYGVEFTVDMCVTELRFLLRQAYAERDAETCTS